MSILELLAERRSRKGHETSKDVAVKMFLNQKQAILDIKDSDGFKEIVEYWKREKDAAEDRLATAKKDEMGDVQAEYRQAKRFLVFLERLCS